MITYVEDVLAVFVLGASIGMFVLLLFLLLMALTRRLG
jgi:hypothetical protein